MKFPVIYLLFFGLMMYACSPKTPASEEEDSTWELLFGDDYSDYSIVEGGKWVIEEGVLTGSQGEEGAEFGFVVPNKTYSNFHLIAEFFPDTAVNSGIFFRCKKDTISPKTGYEANIWDTHPNQDFRTGAMVMQMKPMAHVETNGKWNRYEIKAEGDHIQTWINGEKMTDFKAQLSSDGYIAFQVYKGGTIKFRNIKIQAL